MRAYRAGFWLALLVIAALAAVLAHSRRARPAPPPPGSSVVVASGPPLAAAAVPPGGAAPAPDDGTPTAAPVQLSLLQQQEIGMRVGRVRYGTVAETIRTVGNVVPDQARLAVVQARFAGWVTHEYADQDYQYVRAGQPLIAIYSPEVASSEAAYLVARQNRRLLARSSVAGVAAGAQSLLAASRERLLQWQVPDSEIQRLERTGRVERVFTLDSPVSGYIFQRDVLPSQYIKPGTTLYTVADLSQVWVNAQVFQADAGMLRAGEEAAVTVDAYPGLVLHARVAEIHPMVAAATLTIPVRLVLANPGRKLTPGMFVNVAIEAGLGRQLTVPASAVLQTGTRNIAFIDRGGGYLVPRDVELGPRVGNRFVVRRGLQAGQRIVTSANFLIDSESQLQAALGGYAPPPPGVGVNAPRPAKTRIRFAMVPPSPRPGTERVSVQLSGPAGQAVSGARVTVTFAMPAMPRMGMPARDITAVLTNQGRGRYAGQINLPSGGGWRVTVRAERHGALIASRYFRVGAGTGD
ncbi:MAG: FixH family protein [Terriglobales bacterium]